MNTKMYVGNLPYEVTEDGLRALFASHGQVNEVAVVTDRDTGQPRGFAFVTMEDTAGMKAAIEALNGQDYGGRQLAVNEARPRESRPSFGSGGGGGSRKGGKGRGGW